MSQKVKGLWILVVTLLLSACANSPNKEFSQIQEDLQAEGLERVVFDIGAGAVDILNGPDGSIKVIGTLLDPGSFGIEQTDKTLTISLESGSVHDSLTVYLPAGFSFEVSTFKADLEIQGSYQTIDVKSTAGSIRLLSFDGDGDIWAGRGDVQVEGGAGRIEIISEHGAQSVREFTGNISMTSIMGDLHYAGIENDENEVILEVDHGSVRVDLPSSAGQQVTISSTSGVVTCVGAGLARLGSGCEGTLGTGFGSLNVRTVSGNVELWVTNPVEKTDG